MFKLGDRVVYCKEPVDPYDRTNAGSLILGRMYIVDRTPVSHESWDGLYMSVSGCDYYLPVGCFCHPITTLLDAYYRR
jgi:hypothetical protein